jgi:CheY-like chemotaxis protein
MARVTRAMLEPIGQETVNAVGTQAKNNIVLVVDDDPIVRTICSLLLQHASYSVLEADCGQDGISLFQEHVDQLACVILDYAMPDLDGNLTLAALRHISPEVPVLLISGYIKTQTEVAFGPHRPDGFLQKPFTKAQFLDALQNLIDIEMD